MQAHCTIGDVAGFLRQRRERENDQGQREGCEVLHWVLSLVCGADAELVRLPRTCVDWFMVSRSLAGDDRFDRIFARLAIYCWDIMDQSSQINVQSEGFWNGCTARDG